MHDKTYFIEWHQYIYVLFLLFVFNGFGQNLRVLPPSPNASSLGEYGSVPVGLFTGTPRVDIPIYSIKSGIIKVPISLNYSSNGVKVDQIASNVGMGWTLNAGGVITRVINDDVDELPFLEVPNNFPGANNQEVLDYLINSINPEDNYDTLSDIYSFNFNGFTGTFFLDENRLPILINPLAIKIEKNPNSTYAFKITDPNGIIYWFGDSNSTETTMYQQIGGQNGWTLNKPTSWYLSKIEDSFGNQVNFTYSKYNNTYDSFLSQEVKCTAGVGISGAGQGLFITRSNTSISELSSVISNKVRIVFTYSSNTNGFHKLDRVNIYDKNDTLINKVLLNYDIINSDLLNLKNPHIPFYDSYAKRLFLKNVAFNKLGERKEYKLTYYSPEQLPPRFSYAQDYWGYFNGVTNNNYLVSNSDYFLYTDQNYSLLESIFENVGGNKNPNGIFGKNGLLKKIEYPTTGYTHFFYEPHSYYSTRYVFPTQNNVGLHPTGHHDECDDDFPIDTMTKYLTIGPIPFTHSGLLYPNLFTEEKVAIHFSAGITPCWECDNSSWPTNKIRGTFSAKDADTGLYVKLYKKSTIAGQYMEVSNPFVFLENHDFSNIYIDLIEGKTYTFKSKVFWECVRGDVSLSYYSDPIQEVQENKEVGGLRIKKVLINDNNGNQKVKKYHYGDLSCLDCSSGKTTKPIPAISYNRYYGGSGYVSSNGIRNYITDVITLHSSTLNNLYNKQGYHIGYTSVIEEFGNNFNQGGIMHKYNIPELYKPLPYMLPINGTPFDTNFGTGNELETQIFKKNAGNFVILNKTKNIFYNNPILNKQQIMFNTRLRDVHTGFTSNSIFQNIQSYDIDSYYLKSEWYYKAKTINTKYDLNGENPIITTKNYFYENENHLQLTKTVTKDSNNDILETKIYYPQDKNQLTNINVEASIALDSLISQHRIGLTIQKKVTKNGLLLSKTRTNFSDYGLNAQGLRHIIQPKNIQTSKGTNPLETKITYHNYDNAGNPLEVSNANGTHICYIWGYNKTEPIAKLVNITYHAIPQAELNALLNFDYSTNSEPNLLIALNNLRNALPNSVQITTYTYKPLIGVSTITDPKGDTQYYHYDNFNRLKYVKDAQGNILSENEYHYRP